ncbi:hypothetical protein K7X08_000902 [Anisodus acutangulus]|uniref:Uncharacterized protein n=1 Tax=Anisodus acutangulus TaxID=402998 RepID=A0A9Q1RMW2_9SOLA|nr:hypothetical protein K7X08_000902 [Anisodus acutangulus]
MTLTSKVTEQIDSDGIESPVTELEKESLVVDMGSVLSALTQPREDVGELRLRGGIITTNPALDKVINLAVVVSIMRLTSDDSPPPTRGKRPYYDDDKEDFGS